ncbi:hypothetical protein BIV25_40940 [Streptomyces sp. MUSC 14]|jgi:hypothetical protein|uniref:hypothetical protein n=1 Tax=Streptomyces sp. MUSC 14 TaxID=1354889 RepID=UPI0008F5852E|nr:hypothetical protein [Streptomyces sp. MUSC 14]OIJ86535.1 hypothetical protein BIV25_40940 [Streptomyces sp. MUSC 14]
MITHVSHAHRITGRHAADITLALSIALDLHLPIPKPRAPEVLVTPFPELMGLRTPAVRTHRRKVPLNRLTAVRA